MSEDARSHYKAVEEANLRRIKAQENLDPENQYAGHPYWVEITDTGVKGFRAIFPTPAEDFALPTPEEEGWDLI